MPEFEGFSDNQLEKGLSVKPPGNYDDAFAPPDEDTDVECIHCGLRYRAHEMRYELRPEISPKMLWYCKEPECDGAGFEFDVWALTMPMP
jgi:hypothetical protein